MADLGAVSAQVEELAHQIFDRESRLIALRHNSGEITDAERDVLMAEAFTRYSAARTASESIARRAGNLR